MTATTADQVQKARNYAARVVDRCADAASEPGYFADHVTAGEALEYEQAQRRLAQEIRDGKHDRNFTVAQRMHYYLTGESRPFLAKH